MGKFQFTIFSWILLILITGCNTIKQKTDAIVEKENQKLSKFIGKSSNILQTDFLSGIEIANFPFLPIL